MKYGPADFHWKTNSGIEYDLEQWTNQLDCGKMWQIYNNKVKWISQPGYDVNLSIAKLKPLASDFRKSRNQITESVLVTINWSMNLDFTKDVDYYTHWKSLTSFACVRIKFKFILL